MIDSEIVDLFIAHGAHDGLSMVPRGYRRLYCDVASRDHLDEITSWVQANGGERREGMPTASNTGPHTGKVAASEHDVRPADRYWIVPLEALGIHA